MVRDHFFKTDRCDRCGASPLPCRTMSWFTEEAICPTCSEKEQKIKRNLREMGYDNAMEGYGRVPNPDKL
jgi:hypothetical protein